MAQPVDRLALVVKECNDLVEGVQKLLKLLTDDVPNGQQLEEITKQLRAVLKDGIETVEAILAEGKECAWCLKF